MPSPPLLSCVLLSLIVAVAAAPAAKISYIGDVKIYINSTIWQCDKIYCPPATYRCHVTKQNDPNNSSVLVRENTCFGEDNSVLEQKLTKEEANPHQSTVVKVDAYRNGITSTNSYVQVSSNVLNSDIPEDDNEREVDMNFDDFEAKFDEDISNINKGIEEQLELMSHHINKIEQQFQNY